VSQVIGPDSPPEQRMRAVLRRLRKAYPEARTALDYTTPWELLIATILSAQTTDAQVNEVTPELFRRWPGPEELANADEREVTRVIFATGFHNQKARSIIGTARAVAARGGTVPRRMEQMVQLPGVGRKTASVVLGNAYGSHQGIAVDTHVRRLVRRLGFTTDEDPVKIERTLLELVPLSTWTLFTHLFIAHGRAICTARAPRCQDCFLLSLCPDGQERLGVRRAGSGRAASASPASAGSPASG
jgi:endonuclease III